MMVQINDAVNPVNRETYEAEAFANTYKHEEKHPENQHSAQKKVISDHTKEKIVVRAPKEVFQDADVDVGRKVGEEKESVNGNAVTAAGKKMCGDQLMKELVQVESSRDKHDRHDDKLCKKLAGTFNSEKVQIEVENERDPCANNECTTKVVKQAAKKRRRTILSTKSTSHISAEKEDMQVLDGKSGTLSGKSNASGFGDDPLVLNKAEKEREPLFHEDEGKSNGDAPKSTPTLRDDNAISSDSVTIPSDLTAIKNEQACFLVSGHRLQRKEFQRLIKCLKGKHCRDSHQWCYKATHFVVPDPIHRTEKFLAAAASGRYDNEELMLTEAQIPMTSNLQRLAVN